MYMYGSISQDKPLLIISLARVRLYSLDRENALLYNVSTGFSICFLEMWGF